MSTSESICKFQIKQENFFERISQVLQRKLRVSQKINGRMIDECYLSSKDSPERIKKKMQEEITNKRNISFIAESKFHDVIDPNLINKASDLKLIPYYDGLYYDSIRKIINKIFEHNLVDEIIVMNDHGPRTQIFGEIIKDENVSLENMTRIKKHLKLKSFFDKDYYGVFLANLIPINLKINQINLKKMIF